MWIYKKTPGYANPWLTLWLFFIAFLSLVTSAHALPVSKPANQMTLSCSHDTVPAQRRGSGGTKDEKCRKSLEKSLKSLEKTRERLEDKIGQLDWDRVNREIEKSIKEADLEKILDQTSKTVQQALENIDFKKLEERIEQTLRKAREKLNVPVFQKVPCNAVIRELAKMG